jgi:hypothetical protein
MNTRLLLPCALAIAAACSTFNASAATPGTISFDKNAIKPSPAQSAAIRRAAASDIKEFNHPQNDDWVVVQADINDDGHPDLLVHYTYDSSFCGSSGCSGVIVMATAHGYAATSIDLPNFNGEVDVLATTHRGMHDLRFDDASHVFIWDGKQYP